MAKFDTNELDQGIKDRIKIMESPDYDTGPRLNKTDLLLVIIVSAACIIGMIWGLS